jgi:hypothetical protein
MVNSKKTDPHRLLRSLRLRMRYLRDIHSNKAMQEIIQFMKEMAIPDADLDLFLKGEKDDDGGELETSHSTPSTGSWSAVEGELVMPAPVASLSEQAGAVFRVRVSKEGKLVNVNSTAEQIFGITSESVASHFSLGTNSIWKEIFHPDDFDTFNSLMATRECMRTGPFSETQCIIRCLDKHKKAFFALCRCKVYQPAYDSEKYFDYALVNNILPLPKSGLFKEELAPSFDWDGISSHGNTRTFAPYPPPWVSGAAMAAEDVFWNHDAMIMEPEEGGGGPSSSTGSTPPQRDTAGGMSAR